MRFVIVTGVSGSGKQSALKILEDAGYFCADNLPVPLIPKFAEIAENSHAGEYDKIAIGLDVRSGHFLDGIKPMLEELDMMKVNYEILFMDASDDVLIKRYKETRRTHPIAGNGRIEEGIKDERKQVAFLKERANYVIDTSTLLIRELKVTVDSIFAGNSEFKNFIITVLSFGFKYGIPRDADLVFDVRFLANPFYVPELKRHTGDDRDVRDYVMKDPAAQEFLKKLSDMCTFLIPNYIKEGKNGLVIAIGCTGGKHRSVTIANELSDKLKQFDYAVKTDHRDIKR